MFNTCQPNPNAAHVATQLTRQAHRTISAINGTWPGGSHPEALDDRRKALEQEVSWHPCGSPEAALFKLCVALSVADDLRDMGAVAGVNEYRLNTAYSSIERLIGSVIRYVEQTTGVQRNDFGLHYYHTDRCERMAWGLPLDEVGA